MACNDLDVFNTMLNKRHESYLKRQSPLQARLGGILTMGRGYNRDSCGTSNVCSFSWSGWIVADSIWDNSSTRPLRICVPCLLYYKKKFFLKKCSHSWSHLTIFSVSSPLIMSRSILPRGLSINWILLQKNSSSPVIAQLMSTLIV